MEVAQGLCFWSLSRYIQELVFIVSDWKLQGTALSCSVGGALDRTHRFRTPD